MKSKFITFEQFINEGKLPLDKLVAMINQKYGLKPDCAEVAMFVYDNYNKVTGLNKSARNDEGYFPNEVEALVDEFGFDIDEFSDCYGRVAESTVNEMWIGPFQFNDKMPDDELKKMYDEAVSGYANWQKGFEYPKSDYKKAYQEIEKILKKKGVVVESVINEAKTTDTSSMIEWIEQHMKFVRTTEEFDGSRGGIWVSGESGDTFKGKRIYDYYNEGSAYDLGVLVAWEKELNKRGWYSEWYDAGTVMIWPD